MKRQCKDCRGTGFLLMQNDSHGLRIERCDTCRKYRSDDTAVTAAFKAALKSLVPGWRPIADQNIRHRWDLACKCKSLPDYTGEGEERTVYVGPAYYGDNGIPVCGTCGIGRNYVETEVRQCT